MCYLIMMLTVTIKIYLIQFNFVQKHLDILLLRNLSSMRYFMKLNLAWTETKQGLGQTFGWT